MSVFLVSCMIHPNDLLGSGKALRKALESGWKEWLSLCRKREEEKKMRGMWMIRKGQASLTGKSGGALIEACGFYLVEDGAEGRGKNVLLSLHSCLLLLKIPKCGKTIHRGC